MPARGTFEHKLYKLAMMQHVVIHQTLTEHEQRIASLEAKQLPAPKQEVTMTKLQRARKKFPKAYARAKEKAGEKIADELFAHIAEEKK